MKNIIKIYTDGSDIKGTGKIGYGVFILYNDNEYRMSGISNQSDFKKFYNIKENVSNPTMELMALLKTLVEFRNTDLNIEVLADYQGVQKWISGEWKAKKVYIKDMTRRIHGLINQINENGGSVKLTWVKGHSGDYGNDQADLVAKDRKVYNEIPSLLEKFDIPKSH
ncbi:MAG: putative Ribonuclease HI [uncultured marine phage]|uniref:Putative Ribonuclease HI n=1 Tax=uncultured marine phage TaxID=707152 RepID=A0A8D9CFZ2_9VIRU|nr:MAG: putative Ribonuclease HI [uncultured marine phage]